MNTEKTQAQLDAITELKYRTKRFHLAESIRRDAEETIGRLKETDENGMTALHLAARDIPDAEIILYMIVLEADVNAKDNRGMTPLHWAAGCNPNVDVVKRLVEYSANIRAEDDNGVTPIATNGSGFTGRAEARKASTAGRADLFRLLQQASQQGQDSLLGRRRGPAVQA